MLSLQHSIGEWAKRSLTMATRLRVEVGAKWYLAAPTAPGHHAEQANDGDHRRRRRADLNEAIGCPHCQPLEWRLEIAGHRRLLFLRSQYDPARRPGRDLAIGLSGVSKAAGLRDRRGAVFSGDKSWRQCL